MTQLCTVLRGHPSLQCLTIWFDLGERRRALRLSVDEHTRSLMHGRCEQGSAPEHRGVAVLCVLYFAFLKSAKIGSASSARVSFMSPLPSSDTPRAHK